MEKRKIPNHIDGYGDVKHFKGIVPAGNVLEYQVTKRIKTSALQDKITDMDALLSFLQLRDGMTISFHHHLRNGDGVINYVMDKIAKTGVKDLVIASSGFFTVHEKLIGYIKSGIIKKIFASYINGPLAIAISEGNLKEPAVFQTHGGRARSIESGELHIDVAFIAASECDPMGNLNGKNGKSAFGVLSYARPDAAFADVVVAVSDNIVLYPPDIIEISQESVDHVIKMDKIGTPQDIVSGTTKITENPVYLKIAAEAANIIEASGYLRDNFVFQSGAGGTSLATAAYVKEKMMRNNIQGSTIIGGATKYSIEMLQSGVFSHILDAQCFDLDAIKSVYTTKGHIGIPAGMYASPWNKGAVVNKIDVVVLGATEVDVNFNVNVITNSDGYIIGASGGHSDTAAGAKLTVIVTPLVRKQYPIVLDEVTTLTTPGETVDVIVTDKGVAVNPRRSDLLEKFMAHGIRLTPIEELKVLAEKITGIKMERQSEEKIVAVVEYRDGTVIDIIKAVNSL